VWRVAYYPLAAVAPGLTPGRLKPVLAPQCLNQQNELFGEHGRILPENQLCNLRRRGMAPFTILSHGVILAHLGEASLAIGAIDQTEQCEHDRTPLLINPEMLPGCPVRLISREGQNGFVAYLFDFVGTRRRNQLTRP
jgi:hypothetical protein